MGEAEYIAIPLDTFVGGSKAVVDFYVCLGDNHYIKVVTKGDGFEVDRLRKYQDKDITHLYVTKAEYTTFAEHSARVTEIVATKSPASTGQKMSFIVRSAEHVLTEMSSLGVEEAPLAHAMQVCQSALTVIEGKPQLVDVLDELSKHNEEFVRHAVGTSVISTLMVQGLKWHGKKTLRLASLGGILHDFGMREIPKELWTKPRVEMTKEEVELFQSHPLRGVMLLKELKTVPHEVLGIVGEHHELPSGAGFPRGIKGDKIYPLSRAVAFADNLTELVLKSDRNPKPHSIKEAIDFLHHTMRHDFPTLYFEAALKLLGTEPMKKPA